MVKSVKSLTTVALIVYLILKVGVRHFNKFNTVQCKAAKLNRFEQLFK